MAAEPSQSTSAQTTSAQTTSAQTTSAQTTSGDPSRRSFLVKLSLGVVALAGMSLGALRFGGRDASASTQEFPGPDSIFHPAQDPRQDPRRR